MRLSKLNPKIEINPIKIDYKEFWRLYRGIEQLRYKNRTYYLNLIKLKFINGNRSGGDQENVLHEIRQNHHENISIIDSLLIIRNNQSSTSGCELLFRPL